ncbi:MAG TPA: DUF167 family protein [Stellaceae bacterium]|nr:DUF167 family protein [Stellaceae bacterium]
MPPICDLPLTAAADGVRVAVQLRPRARDDRIDGVVQRADGRPVLRVSVTALPAEGRANAALLQLLAREWRVPRRDIALVGGQKSRSKIVHVGGDTPVLLRRLRSALAALPRS